MAVVIIFHVFAYLLSQFEFDFRILGDHVNHHSDIVRGSISSSYKECTELLKDLIFWIARFLAAFSFVLGE